MIYSEKYNRKAHGAWLILILGMFLLGVAGQAGAMELTADQKMTILREAEAAFNRGWQRLPDKPVAARLDFQEAARKYQLLADSGVSTGQLYYNLGNAYLQVEKVGKAIANYKRAGQLLGPNQQLEENLRYARSLCNGARGETDKNVSTFLDGWNRHFPTSTKLWCGVGAWLIFWAAMIARLLLKKKIRWRYILACSAVVFAVMAGSVGYEVLTLAGQTQGVVTVSAAPVLRGNGEGFAKKFKEPLTEGREFKVMEQRGDWLHIKFDDDKTGWINAAKAEIIKPRSWQS